MNKCVNKLIPNYSKIEVAFKTTKLSSWFNVKDKINIEHMSSWFNVKDKINIEHNYDLIHHSKCPEPTFIDDYMRESARRIAERIQDHNVRDHTSQVWNHSKEKSHNNFSTRV